MPASSVSVSFPTLRPTSPVVMEVKVVQEEYKHDIAIVRVPQAKPGRASFLTRTPIVVNWARGRDAATFDGYIHHTENVGNDVLLWCRGASSVFDDGLQTNYRRRTVTSVANELARGLNFDADIVGHGRIFDDLAFPGGRRWEALVDYAKEIGYSLYFKNTRMLMHPRTATVGKYLGQAPVFTDGREGVRGTLFDFQPIDGSAQPGEYRHVDVLTGIDRRTGYPFRVRNAPALGLLGQRTYTPTGTTYHNLNVSTAEEARWKAQAMAENKRFNLTATCMAEGVPRVHQTWPVLLAGVDTPYIGAWFVKKVTHRIVPTEYMMDLELGRDATHSNVTIPDDRARRVVSTRNNPQGRPKSTYPPSVLANGQWRASWSAASRTFGGN